MNAESGLLARYDGSGSVTCCQHGFVHVQLGLTTLTLTHAQYQRFVAMLADSAASFDLLAASGVRPDNRPDGRQSREPPESDYGDPLPN